MVVKLTAQVLTITLDIPKSTDAIPGPVKLAALRNALIETAEQWLVSNLLTDTGYLIDIGVAGKETEVVGPFQVRRGRL